jgi:hypothetical protein
MGTSAGYNMPKGGDWTPLKYDATRFARHGGHGSINPKSLLGRYLQANGGAQAIAQGRGGSSGHSASRYRIGSSARSAGDKLGGFLSSIATKGLDITLQEDGLGHLIGKSATEICAGLLDILTDSANTLDDHATRKALSDVFYDLFKPDTPYEDIEQELNQSLDEKGIMLIIADFFGYYLYELFCRDFYEDWQKKVGIDQTKRSLWQVKNCIFAEVESKFASKSIDSIGLSGSAGKNLAEQIMQDTLEIFEVV